MADEQTEQVDQVEQQEDQGAADTTKEMVKAIFDLYDKDKSGAIDRSELANLLRALGDNPTTQDISDLIEAGDEDQSNTLDFDELCRLYEKRAIGSLEDRTNALVECFRKFDKSGDGKLNKEELKDLFCAQGADNLDEDDVQALLEEVDADDDGFVSIEEFAQRLCS